MNPDQNQPTQPINNPLKSMQPGETVICEIRRHPIGLLSMHLIVGLLLISVAAVVYGVLPHALANTSSSKVYTLGTLGLVIVAVLSFLFLLAAHKVYWGNRWILTSDSLTQIRQFNLFDKQSSQLSLANLEDVTAEQNGLLTHMFNFGALSVETAGERSKFLFPFCPKPNFYAGKILEARERFEQGGSNQDGLRPQQPAAPAPQPNPAPPADPTPPAS